jgi:hypothetical protein
MDNIIKELGVLGVHTINIKPRYKLSPLEVLITSESTALFSQDDAQLDHIMCSFHSKSLEEALEKHKRHSIAINTLKPKETSNG